jgi:hypothetical protein
LDSLNSGEDEEEMVVPMEDDLAERRAGFRGSFEENEMAMPMAPLAVSSKPPPMKAQLRSKAAKPVSAAEKKKGGGFFSGVKKFFGKSKDKKQSEHAFSYQAGNIGKHHRQEIDTNVVCKYF